MKLLLFLPVIIMFLVLTIHPSYGQETTENDLLFFVTNWFSSVHGSVPIIVGAFIIGMVGSLAYYVALRLGFVSAELVEEKFNSKKTLGALGFIALGGAVAIVFQLPQMDAFTPIQSFVLGITWPFIVSQYASRASTEGADVIKKLFKGA